MEKSQFVTKLLSFQADIIKNRFNLSFFYYSGHALLKNGTDYLVFSDGDEVATNEIVELLRQTGAERILIILDCFYAGAVSIGKQTENVIQNLKLLNRKGIDILCACSADKAAYPY